MPRLSHAPEDRDRRQVEALAGYGVREAEIAGLLEIDPKTLRKHYRRELDHGHVKANAKVAENLFRKATGDGRESVVAAIFWLKARAHWRETSLHEFGGRRDRSIANLVCGNVGVASAVLSLNRLSGNEAIRDAE